jgi:hypothetical protein
MYDKYVRTALEIKLPAGPVDDWYARFREQVKTVTVDIDQRASFAETDRYLWLKGQKETVRKHPARLGELSQEIRELRLNQRALWAQL